MDFVALNVAAFDVVVLFFSIFVRIKYSDNEDDHQCQRLI